MKSGLQFVHEWESKKVQEASRAELERMGPSSLDLESFARWFKHTFFTFVHSVQCIHCGSTNTSVVGSARPNAFEKAGSANRVEVHKCNSCSGHTRLPRYNAVTVLLTTRRGRCGEASNLAGALLRAAGYSVRHVTAVEDHVWLEVFDQASLRWLHYDPCEAALGNPTMYEKGWGKEFTFCIACNIAHTCDVTKSYSKNWPTTLSRRPHSENAKLCQLLARQTTALLSRLDHSQRAKELMTILCECWDPSKALAERENEKCTGSES